MLMSFFFIPASNETSRHADMSIHDNRKPAFYIKHIYGTFLGFMIRYSRDSHRTLHWAYFFGEIPTALVKALKKLL